ncbi:MAG: hypothetical protein LCH30_11445 [Proteobacteria bacterium]|nr:hypothetical protein [Pseudomonadota bacterium]
MKTKFEAIYEYEGLGFPVMLENVEMFYINDEWYPKIDVHHIANKIIQELAVQEDKLTGNQLKFIRSYFAMPLRQFGMEVVHESHTAVNKWEKHGNQITNMNENTEQVLRLYIIEHTQTQREEKLFFRKFQKTKVFAKSKNTKPKPIKLNLCA